MNPEKQEALRIARLVAKETNSLALLGLLAVVTQELVKRTLRKAKLKVREIGVAGVIVATRMFVFK